MRRLPAFLLLAALAVLLPRRAPGQYPPDSAIMKQLTLYAQRMHDKQRDAILSSYTPDAVFADPSGKRYSTPLQIRELYDQVFANFDSDLHFKPPSSVAWRDHTVHINGSYTEQLRDRSTGRAQQLHGNYGFALVILPNGQWKFQRMAWTVAPDTPR